VNERIKLPAQEWLGYDPERGDLHGYTFEQMREFADLIVRECAELSTGYTGNVKLLICNHFGLEP
jgi:hypothetical protein